MKNRGQALVFFILILPIILLALAFVVDIGNLNSVKKSTDQKITQIIETGLQNNLTEEEWNQLIEKNFSSIENKKIILTDNQVELSIDIKLQTIFSNLMKQSNYKITYTGHKENNKIKIIRK